MQISSNAIAVLQTSVGSGQEITIPETVLLTLDKMPLPLDSASPAAAIDLRGRVGSVLLQRAINQGAGTGPTTALMATFDRGIYRIKGGMMSVIFGGPASSSANIKAANTVISNPGASFQSELMATPIGLWGEAYRDHCDVVIQFLTSGYTLNLVTRNASGAGESIGVDVNCYVQRLL